MPKKFLEFIEGHNIYICLFCGTHLSSLNDLVSTNYRSHAGNAYLFNCA
jgi:hypothetical protein